MIKEEKMTEKERLIKYIKNHNYFSLSHVIKELSLKNKTTKNYLLEFKKEKLIYDAGSGFYSTIKSKYELLPNSRVLTLSKFLRREFPYTKFIIWNTKQLQSLYHHLQQHHITFIEVEKEAVLSFYEKISIKYRNTTIEQQTKEYFNSINIVKDPVIVRKLLSRSPVKKYSPELEKILIDMYIDIERYKYISFSDYWELWRALLSDYRISIGHFYNYSKRRNCYGELCSEINKISKELKMDLCQNNS